jgi:formate hydrogenlyase transcriptional activator
MESSPSSANPFHPASSPYQILLEVAEAISLHRDLRDLFHDLAERLHRVVQFDYLNLILHDPARNVMRLHILETSKPTHIQEGYEMPMEWTAAGHVFESQQALVVPDLDQETRFPAMVEVLKREGIGSVCLLPLATAQRKVGVLGFGRFEKRHYLTAELEFMQQVARQVAVAVDNARNYERAQKYRQQLADERDRLRVLLDINNAIISNLDLRELFAAIAAALRRVMHHEYTSLALYDAKKNVMRLRALDFPQGLGFIKEEMEVEIERSPSGSCFTARKPRLYGVKDFGMFSPTVQQRLAAERVRSVCCIPLLTHDRALGAISLASFRDNAFSEQDFDMLGQVGTQVAIAVENALSFQEIGELKNKLAEEKLYLEDEIRSEFNFEEIVGESPALLRVLKELETVAPTESTVLIHGETGTGKELIARAIHNLSERRDRTFVKVNCAAIPLGLLESELFGHERGAFTGALAQKIGRFEFADGGTLFLDEVGDIPLELQPKLLRVLQEQEFEHLGGTRTIHVDVRLVAATNRDLTQMVADRQFRSDLFYRLNVFPLQMPPLRQRHEDVPLLVRYFAQKYARRMNKQIESIPAETMNHLANYHWPGNIRELENLIERAVILSKGSVLEVPLGEMSQVEQPSPIARTIREAERDLIVRTLQETRWILSGPKGAASRLGMKRTTLQSRMRKLGIRRP